MAGFDLPASNFEPHPDGMHQGVIIEVRDMGEKETQYGVKHQGVAIIESSTAIMDKVDDNGVPMPFTLWVWFTFSGAPRSKLTDLRQQMLRRPLSADEALHFDPDQEWVNQEVSYAVKHAFTEQGTFANLLTWSPAAPPAPAPRPQPAPPQQQSRPAPAAPRPAGRPAQAQQLASRRSAPVNEMPPLDDAPPPGDDDLTF